MKKSLLIVAAALLASVASAQNISVKAFSDSVGITKKGFPIYATVKVDYPISGPSNAVNSIKSCLLDYFQIDRDDTKDGKTYAHVLAQSQVNRLVATFEDSFEKDDPLPPEMAYDLTIVKAYESNTLVTYTFGSDEYLGGVHGTPSVIGITFVKSDGYALGITDYLKEDAWDQIQDKVAASLRKYFDVKTNKELADELQGEGIICDGKNFFVPMTDNSPFVENGDLVFIYSAYEIASFAAGLPEVRIPLKDIQGFLKPDFAKLVK